jgi:hypothetical protein
MSTIATGTSVTLHNGRVATVTPRTYNTCTGFVVWLTAAEAKVMKLQGHSTGRYSYSVDMAGNIERWVNGYGGKITSVEAPTING